jgi:tripartite-type tricarboxylate transporter receptor subunit TctC
MSITRRRASCLLAGAGALAASPRAFAQSAWPDRPVHLVVTFIAGGANDIIARLLGQGLSDRLGQQFIIDNRAGAGGNVGTEYVTHQQPDGYTFLQLSNAAAANASLYPNLNFNILTDLTPVAGTYDVPFVLVVRPDFPAKNMAEFVAYAKANPGKMSHGSGGVGSVSHVAAELFKMMTGTQMTHVPYRGSPIELGDLIGGRIECAFDPLPTSLPHVLDGSLRAIAVTSAKRAPSLPDVPSIGETIPGYDASSLTGTAAPKGLPSPIAEKLNGHINAVLATPEFQKRMAALGATPLILSPGEFGKLMKDETEKWAKVVKFANIKPE